MTWIEEFCKLNPDVELMHDQVNDTKFFDRLSVAVLVFCPADGFENTPIQ